MKTKVAYALGNANSVMATLHTAEVYSCNIYIYSHLFLSSIYVRALMKENFIIRTKPITNSHYY